MKVNRKISIAAILFFTLSIVTYAQTKWTENQKDVIATIERLSETTVIDGEGADAYAAFLSEDFSRWTIGSAVLNNKADWVLGVKGWFDDGWRVSEREQEYIEVLIIDNYAHTRRIVSETYLGPEGDSSISKAALAEIWVINNGKWLLFRVNVHPMMND